MPQSIEEDFQSNNAFSLYNLYIPAQEPLPNKKKY